jgi:hypothetical protein
MESYKRSIKAQDEVRHPVLRHKGKITGEEKWIARESAVNVNTSQHMASITGAFIHMELW